MKKVLLVKYGEIALRGKNRHLFEKRLLRTIKKNLGSDCYELSREMGRILVEDTRGDIEFDDVLPKVLCVLGVAGVCHCIMTEDQSIENLEQLAAKFMQEFHSEQPLSFKVESRRAKKAYPMNSQEISARIGGYVLESQENLRVDVHKPQVQLNVELRKNAYIFSNVIKGLGGLPVGSSGKGMLLLSGGIDSPIAGFLSAKRGVELEAVYFHSPPYTSERAKIKVCDLAERLAVFTGNLKLHVVHFTDVQLYLKDNGPPEKQTIFLKRAMLKAADKLAKTSKCQCLITGDSIGQVASQTLHSILAINSAAKLPVLRPLAGMDKQEIVDLAKQLETFEISIRPYEDCCTIFVPDHPDLSPKLSIIESMERKFSDLDSLINEAVTKAEQIIF